MSGQTSHDTKMDCYKKLLNYTMDESICTGASTTACKDVFGMAKKDPTLCRTAECYADVAISLEDPTVCEISSGKSDCYYIVAITTNNADICEDIACSSNYQGYCYDRNNCFYQLAAKIGDYKLCDEIQGSIHYSYSHGLRGGGHYEIKTQGDCYAVVAISKNDSEICSNLKNDTYRDTCYFTVGAKQKDKESCNKVEGEVLIDYAEPTYFAFENSQKPAKRYKYHCLGFIGNPIEDCTDEPASLRDFCWDALAREKFLVDACENIDSETSRDSCLLFIGKESKNVAACEKITDTSVSDKCWYYMAMDKGIAHCKNIKDNGNREQCQFLAK